MGSRGACAGRSSVVLGRSRRLRRLWGRIGCRSSGEFLRGRGTWARDSRGRFAQGFRFVLRWERLDPSSQTRAAPATDFLVHTETKKVIRNYGFFRDVGLHSPANLALAVPLNN